MIAESVIRKFLNVNDINLKSQPVIKLDYGLDEEISGCYYYKDDLFSIYINPYKCDDYNENLRCYTSDLTLIGVCIHEFAHFLCYQIYPTLTQDYKDKFPTKRLCLNWYSNTDIDEELAEIIRLYITNPLLIKLIDAQVYRFIRRYFKSAYQTSNSHTHKFYKDYTESTKLDLKTKWGIVYNESTKKFEKLT